jgi:PAS domain S-box-containing protein
MKNLFIGILVLMHSGLFAQSQVNIDSLVQRLTQISDDSNKVYLLDKLSYEYSFTNAQTGIKYGNDALRLAKKLEWKKGEALAYLDIAINYRAKFENTLALEYAIQALQIYRALDNKNGIAASMSHIAGIHTGQGNYAKALEYSFLALKIYEASNDSRHKPIILENIGTIYLEQGELKKAKQYYLSASRINIETNDSISIARSLGNIAIILNEEGNYDSAIAYSKISLKINNGVKDKHAAQINLANIANSYLKKRDFPMALKYHRLALTISEETGHKNCIAINLGNIGETYFELAKDTEAAQQLRSTNLSLAIKYLKDAIDICKTINYPAPQMEFMQYLKDAYSLSGDYKKALITYEDYTTIKDSVYSEQSKHIIAGLEANRELGIKTKNLEIKEGQLRIKELELAKKKRDRILYAISILLSCGVIGIILRRLADFRKSNRTLKILSKRAEDKLVHHEYRLKQAQEIAHIGNWEMNYKTGLVVWSEETCRIYGHSPEDMIHSYEQWLSYNHPDDVVAIEKVIALSNEMQTPSKFYHRIVRKDGTIRHLYSESHFERNDLGQAIGVYGIVQDVTEMKENEEFLRKSNERFELVNQATREAILDWDIVNDVTFWGNGFTEIFGYAPSDFYNHLLSDNIHPEDRDEALGALNKVLEDPTRNLLLRNLRFFRADKSIAYVQIRTVLIRSNAGKAIRAVSSIRDVTESIKNLKAIEEQNAALREIAWIQSHVVRSPLANIMALIGLLKNKEQYDIDEKDLIEKIQTVSEKLNDVICDVVKKTEAVEHSFNNDSNTEHI